MAARQPPLVIRRGTAQEIAEHAAGYAASGESEHSRRAASTPYVEMRGFVRKGTGKRSPAQLVAEVRSALTHLRADLLAESSPTRRAKLEKNIAIKGRFLARLEAEAGR